MKTPLESLHMAPACFSVVVLWVRVWVWVQVEGVSLLPCLVGGQHQPRCGLRPCRADYANIAELSLFFVFVFFSCCPLWVTHHPRIMHQGEWK